MKVHVLRNSHRESRGWSGLRALEWLFLLFGLVAIDAYIWVNTSAVLYQAYQDWAFDQRLRALPPSPRAFAGDEIRTLLGRDRPTAGTLESNAVPPKSEPWPGTKSLVTGP